MGFVQFRSVVICGAALVIASLLGELEASAALRISSTQSSTSRVEISGSIRSDAVWVMLHVTRTDVESPQPPTIRHIYRVADPAALKMTVGLRQGAGDYKITAFVRAAPDRGGYYDYLDDFEVTNTDTQDRTGLLPSEWVESDAPEFIALKDEILKPLGDLSALPAEEALRKKSRAFYDWVVKNFVYDYAEARLILAALARGELPAKPMMTALEMLKEKKGVCAGFSHVLVALHRAAGIPAYVVHGYMNADGITPADEARLKPPTPASPQIDDERVNFLINHAWVSVPSAGGDIIIDPTWGNTTGEANRFWDFKAADFATTHRKLKVQILFSAPKPSRVSKF